MSVDADNFRLIFGLKLKRLRQKKDFALKDLAERTGLSISFLSEIEKGKKYPKPEKIMQMATALDVSFDDLVSLRMDDDLREVTSLLASPLLKEFPFELFGFTPRDLLELMTASPTKAGAFIRTFLEIGQSYDMRVEHFLLAALRSYQKMHLNYFKETEDAVERFANEVGWDPTPPVDTHHLQWIFLEKYSYELEESTFEDYPELRGFRSIWLGRSPRRLLINKNLLPMQKAFIIGREIGFSYLELSERPVTSSWIKIESFEQVLNNFKASYFSGALLINRELLRSDLEHFFGKKEWEGETFLELMHKYEATPEMFLYRLSQLIPRFFGLKEIFYLRFSNKAGSEQFRLTKELNMSRVRVPHGIGLNEHYCRRWLSVHLLKELGRLQEQGDSGETIIDAQRSRFLESDAEFFTITLARPLALSTATNSSISLGFLMNDKFKRTVRFWDDPAVSRIDVNETCERCGLTPAQCQERVAEPSFYHHEQELRERERRLQDFLEERGMV